MKGTPNIAITVTVAAILVGLLSFVLPKNEEKYLAEHFWTRKTHSAHKYNVVVMGDSRIYRGISPDAMKSALPGLKIINFGYSNGGLNPVMFSAAEKRLDTGADVKVMVIGVSANTLTGYTENNNQYIQELTRPREEVVERLWLSPVKYWFSPTSPEGLKNHFFGETPEAYYTNEYHLNGYVKSVKFPADTMEAIPSYIKDFTHYKVDGRKMNDLFMQVSDWTKKGVVCVAFRPPVSHPMYMLEDTMGLYNEAAIKEGIKASGGFWFDIKHTEYKTYDGSHLTENSAVKLSMELGEFINQLVPQELHR